MKCPECHHDNPDHARFCSKCGVKFPHMEESPTSEAAAPTLLASSSTSQAIIGTVIAGRYEILQQLGTGGMGKVYRVKDRQIDEEVALKVLRPEIAADGRKIERFHNELKLARKISHGNVCRMYHLAFEEGIPYITMEYVAGEELASLIKRRGPVSVQEAVSIAAQVCDGLAEAHRVGIVHRDLKPQNIMIDEQGKAIIMDFGIAHSVETSGATEEGMIIGTPDYMSPEQVSGKNVDGRSDIYSLGVILFELLTGTIPFDGDSPLSIALKHKTQEPPDPRDFNPDIPEVMAAMILKCMKKDQDKRYQGAGELLAELREIERSIAATGEVTFDRTQVKRIGPAAFKGLKWAAVAVALGLVLVGAYFLKKKIFAPALTYENVILLDLFSEAPNEINKDLLEYVIGRSLTASTRLNIFSRGDFEAYRAKSAKKISGEQEPEDPVIAITGVVNMRVSGFELEISIRHENRTDTRTFDCKGYSDYISSKSPDIMEFIADESGGIITGIEGGRSFTRIASENLDALEHFLAGEKAWGKLDSDEAFSEFKTATENDPEFSLAFIRLADVLVFLGDREEAKIKLEIALQKKEKLIDFDLLRLQALMARINSRPTEERELLRKLTEAFPFKKEYHYEFAESYFHTGDAHEAVKHYSKALDLDPDYSLAHNHIAYAYAWMGKHDLARSHFIDYIKLDNTANSYDSLAAGYMFAGMYDEAIKTLGKGIALDPDLDYLYRNVAVNFLLKGSLKKADEYMDKQISVTRLENTRGSANFYLAYIEFLRGNADKAAKKLKPAVDFFSAERFSGRLDEAPVLPLWFTGVLAYQKGDVKTLSDMTALMEKKIQSNDVTPTNYFPIYKFYLHLKILEGYLKNDTDIIVSGVAEGRRIKERMGYWDSMFNIAYFFNEYAAILMMVEGNADAAELLAEAAEYNPGFAQTHVNLAKYHFKMGDPVKAEKEYQTALKLLKDADKNYILLRELKTIEKQLSEMK
ncbi:MAG: protein kinase [Pseudomonadota bacterium]